MKMKISQLNTDKKIKSNWDQKIDDKEMHWISKEAVF